MRVVAGLIFHQDQILVCQRRPGGPFPLRWEFPGGKVELGESEMAALRRELREELDIDVVSATEVLRHRHVYDPTMEVELIFFQVHRYRGTLENRTFRRTTWARPHELDRFDFLEGDLPVLKQLRQGILPAATRGGFPTDDTDTQ